MRKLRSYFKNWPPMIRWIVASILILIGILGLLLPIMPGWPFLIPGVLLLGNDTRITGWLSRRFRLLRVEFRRRRRKH